ncbi:hypothetical protein 000TH009_195 [Bacillus phage 000TH009]|nr:hypothetical protein 000TH009_195 [Bacillus phage 000TH009]
MRQPEKKIKKKIVLKLVKRYKVCYSIVKLKLTMNTHRILTL